MKKILTPVTWAFITITLFSSCKKDLYHADISKVDVDIKIKRFEVDLFSLDLNHIADSIPFLYDKYGEFFDLFNYKIINIGGAGQITYPAYLKLFLTDFLNNEVYHFTMDIFPEVSDLENQFERAFSYYSYHFPNREIPDIITYVSRFNQSVVTAEGVLGIGLDKYLGIETDYYKRLALHNYMVKNMHPDKIVSDCMMAWLLSEFEFNDSVDNVLSNMIYHGQIMFGVKSMLPDEPDSLIMGFTANELQFCEMNEEKMWNYLVEQKLLFQTDRMIITKFIGYGPFTSDFTQASPARAAVWIGWRIVEDYARRHPHLSLAEIMNEKDYQKILTLSKYNP